MNRRSFLGFLAGATATSYFFAPIGGWKSDVIVQPRCIADMLNINGGTLPPEAYEIYWQAKDSNHVWSNDGFSYGSLAIRKGDIIRQRHGEKTFDLWGPDSQYKGALLGEITSDRTMHVWGRAG